MIIHDHFEYQGYRDTKAYCDLRIVFDRDTENLYFLAIDRGEGTSITNAAETLWEEVNRYYELNKVTAHYKEMVFLEKYPNDVDAYQVHFDDGKVSWSRFDQDEFERLFQEFGL